MADLAGWDGGRELGGRVKELVESTAALVAVTIGGGEPIDYLHGGEAVEAVWIAATAAGLAVQPIVPLFLFARHEQELRVMGGQYAEGLGRARRRLWELLSVVEGHEIALLLRLGYAPAPSAVSLRAMETVRQLDF